MLVETVADHDLAGSGGRKEACPKIDRIADCTDAGPAERLETEHLYVPDCDADVDSARLLHAINLPLPLPCHVVMLSVVSVQLAVNSFSPTPGEMVA